MATRLALDTEKPVTKVAFMVLIGQLLNSYLFITSISNIK